MTDDSNSASPCVFTAAYDKIPSEKKTQFFDNLMPNLKTKLPLKLVGSAVVKNNYKNANNRNTNK
jgi:hypothetical protein